MNTRIYQCEVGVAKYWVSAEDGFDAVRLVKEDTQRGGYDREECEPLAVEEVSEAKALSIRFHDDDTGTVIPLWEEFQRDKAPRLLACSEW